MKKSPNQVHALILVQNLPVPFDRRVWMEATTLQRAGYEVTVICPNSRMHPKFREVIDGVDIYRFPLPFEGKGVWGAVWEYCLSLSLMTFLATWVALRKSVDIVHICNPPDLLFLCALPVRCIRKSKLIFDQHDLGPELWEAKGHNISGLVGRCISLAEWATFKSAHVVISTNESYRDIATSRGRKARDRVFIVRSAPRRAFAIPQPVPARVINSRVNLVYLGTMGNQEGIDILLEAMSLIRDHLSKVQVHLDLIGDGPERPLLENKVKDLRLGESCHFLGRVPDSQLRAVVSNADIAINPDRPSKMNDLSSMNKIVEYMALGTPIIQFPCIEGERTALDAAVLASPANAESLANSVTTLINNVELRQRMKTAGWSRFKEELCWETQEQMLLAAYRSCLEE